jgi:hypothetical protein
MSESVLGYSGASQRCWAVLPVPAAGSAAADAQAPTALPSTPCGWRIVGHPGRLHSLRIGALAQSAAS